MVLESPVTSTVHYSTTILPRRPQKHNVRRRAHQHRHRHRQRQRRAHRDPLALACVEHAHHRHLVAIHCGAQLGVLALELLHARRQRLRVRSRNRRLIIIIRRRDRLAGAGTGHCACGRDNHRGCCKGRGRGRGGRLSGGDGDTSFDCRGVRFRSARIDDDDAGGARRVRATVVAVRRQWRRDCASRTIGAAAGSDASRRSRSQSSCGGDLHNTGAANTWRQRRRALLGDGDGVEHRVVGTRRERECRGGGGGDCACARVRTRAFFRGSWRRRGRLRRTDARERAEDTLCGTGAKRPILAQNWRLRGAGARTGSRLLEALRKQVLNGERSRRPTGHRGIRRAANRRRGGHER